MKNRKHSGYTAIKNYLENYCYLKKPSIGKIKLGVKVSVVIPLYNEEKLVEKIINSLINQDTKNFEVILVDNGSTDKTLEVIKKLQKNINFHFYVIEEPKPGVANARKRGMDEVLLRLLKREVDLNHFLAVTDADVIPPKNWISKILDGFKLSNIGGLAGTHGVSKELDQKIEKATGIKNYFNLIPKLIQFLEKNKIGKIKMSGPNSAFSAIAYALGGGIKQEYDSWGKVKLNEVDNLGKRISSLNYIIAPMNCTVIKNRRRELFELLYNIENSYFLPCQFLKERFSVIRKDENYLLNLACKTVPPKKWEVYRYKMIYKVLRNFIFQPITLKEIKINKEIKKLFTQEEIELFSSEFSFLRLSNKKYKIFKNFLPRLEKII